MTAGHVAVLLLSFAFACWQSAASPTTAYFSTATRVWELGVDAALAFGADRLRTGPAGWGTASSWSGLLLIGAATFVVVSGPAFTGPLAELPVLGTALVIGGGCVLGARTPVLLGNRLAVHIGAVSYSWYLWHFPILIFLQVIAVPGSRRTLVGLVLGLLIAEASYRLVERPVLRLGRTGRTWSRYTVTVGVRRSAGAIAIGASIVPVLGVVLVPAVQAKASGPTVDEAMVAAVHPVQQPGTPAASVERGSLEALRIESWPTLVLAAAEVAALGSPTDFDAHCAAMDIADLRSCTFGAKGGSKVVVLGDSLGITLLPTVV